MTITVATWGTYGGWRGRREVSTSEEARNLCAEVEAHDGSGRVLVGFTASSGHFLAIGLGHEQSCVMYWESVDPPYFQSRGQIGPGEPLDFAYDGQHTEVQATTLMSREAARKALGEFVERGERPSSVEWDET